MFAQKQSAKLELPKKVHLAAHRPLGIDRITLFVDILWIQLRSFEKVREAIQALIVGIVIDFKHVVGDIQPGVSILTTTVITHKFAVAISVRVFLGAQEQHMLQIVRHALLCFRVLQ